MRTVAPHPPDVGTTDSRQSNWIATTALRFANCEEDWGTAMGGKSTSNTPRAARTFSDTFAAQLLLGGLFTVGFYGAVAVMPEQWSFFQRYFCSHPLEYVTTALFFVAMGTLLLSSFSMVANAVSSRAELPGPSPIQPLVSNTPDWLVRLMNWNRFTNGPG